MEKQKKIISFKNLSEEMLELYKIQYPGGYDHNDIKVIDLGNSKKLYTILIEAEDVNYLVKVEAKIDRSNLITEKQEIYQDISEEMPILDEEMRVYDEKNFISDDDGIDYDD